MKTTKRLAKSYIIKNHKTTAKMIHNKNLIIPAGKEVVLESGGSHMMLMGPRRDIQAGEIVKMIARDKMETRYMLDLKVIDPRSSHDHDHNHDHKHDHDHKKDHKHGD